MAEAATADLQRMRKDLCALAKDIKRAAADGTLGDDAFKKAMDARIRRMRREHLGPAAADDGEDNARLKLSEETRALQQQMVATLTEQVQELTTQNELRQQSIEDLKKAIVDSNAAKRSSNSALEVMTKQKAAANAHSMKNYEEALQAKIKADELTAELKRLQDEQAAGRAQVLELKQKLEVTKAGVDADSQAKIDALTQQLATSEADKKQRNANDAEQLERFTRRVAEVERERDARIGELEKAVQNASNARRATLADERKRIEELTEELTSAQRAIAVLQHIQGPQGVPAAERDQAQIPIEDVGTDFRDDWRRVQRDYESRTRAHSLSVRALDLTTRGRPMSSARAPGQQTMQRGGAGTTKVLEDIKAGLAFAHYSFQLLYDDPVVLKLRSLSVEKRSELLREAVTASNATKQLTGRDNLQKQYDSMMYVDEDSVRRATPVVLRLLPAGVDGAHAWDAALKKSNDMMLRVDYHRLVGTVLYKHDDANRLGHAIFLNSVSAYLRNYFETDLPAAQRLVKLLQRLDAGLRTAVLGSDSEVLTYVKFRCDADARGAFKRNDKRFMVSVDDVDRPRSLLVRYNQDGKRYYGSNAAAAGAGVGDPQWLDCVYGPFTGVFGYALDNEEMARQCVEIKQLLSAGRSVFVMGYGASGAGKTTTLIYDKVRKQRGVLLYLLAKMQTDKVMFPKVTLRITEYLVDYVSTPQNVQVARKLGDGGMEMTWSSVNKDYTKGADTLGAVVALHVDQQRAIAPTTNNPNSSRSHVLVDIELGPGQSLFIGDFAGVENRFACDDLEVLRRMAEKYDAALLQRDRPLACPRSEVDAAYAAMMGGGVPAPLVIPNSADADAVDLSLVAAFDALPKDPDEELLSLIAEDLVISKAGAAAKSSPPKTPGAKTPAAKGIASTADTATTVKLLKAYFKCLPGGYRQDAQEFAALFGAWDMKVKARADQEARETAAKADAAKRKLSAAKVRVTTATTPEKPQALADVKAAEAEVEATTREAKAAKANVEAAAHGTEVDVYGVADDAFVARRINGASLLVDEDFSEFATRLNEWMTGRMWAPDEKTNRANGEKFLSPGHFTLFGYAWNANSYYPQTFNNETNRRYAPLAPMLGEWNFAEAWFGYRMTWMRRRRAAFNALRKSCDCRAYEGAFINLSLKATRAFIKQLMPKRSVPAFVDACAAMQCNPLYQGSCFRTPAAGGRGGDPDRALVDAMYKDVAAKKPVMAVFCVFNLSRAANDPPPIPYVDCTELKLELNRLRTLEDGVFRLPADDSVEDAFRDMLNLNTSGAVDAAVVEGLRGRVAEFAAKLGPVAAEAQKLLDDLATGGSRDALEAGAALVQLLDTSNAATAIGTLEFTDTMSKFGRGAMPCNFSEQHALRVAQKRVAEVLGRTWKSLQ